MLSFFAEGPSGTKGYVKITLEQDPTFNPQDISVLLDGQPIEYAITSTNQSWVLDITYAHSIHNIVVNLNAEEEPEPFPTTGLIISSATAIITGAIIAIYLKKYRHKTENANPAREES